MRKFTNGLLCMLIILFATSANAQQVIRCSTTEHEAELLRSNPVRAKEKAKLEQQLQKFLQNQSSQRTQQIISIPVVVHVVYNGTVQNISDAQVLSQIEVLNADFGHYNADSANTPAAFRSVAGATNLQFCMAKQDPNGLATNGIERRSTSVTSFSTNDNVKYTSSGGLDIWDPTRYFNIWVCKLGGGILGYGEFPTASVSYTYGVVIDYRYFGTIGTATAPFNKGRTATHEVGHCFNLYHIWGDDGSGCTGTDYCNDTPNQADENYNCPSFPLFDNCTSSGNGVMFMNFMDYVDDGCMNFFTTQQANRVNFVINSAPYNALANSTACQALSTAADDAGITSINSPSGTQCNGTLNPNVVLENFGSNALTNVDIHYILDGGSPVIFNWVGNLSTSATTSVSLPSLTATPGAHSLTIYTTAPNGQTDGDYSNDTSVVAFTVAGAGSALALPYTEGFETAFPSTGMTINNPDASTTWERTSTAAKSGTWSVMMDNFDYDASGEVDEIVLPALDLTSGSSGNTTPYLSFQMAYQLYTDPNAPITYSDTLAVLVSVDCGLTFTQVYKKFSIPLTTIIPVFSLNEFIPSSANWRKDSINLNAFRNSNDVIIKFLHTTDYENNLYLDDINISQRTATGISTVSLDASSVYPNPASAILNIRLSESARIEIFNVNGQLVYDSVTPVSGNNIQIDVAHFTDGVYTIRATSATTVYPGRFVKN